jgi:hypothetical protein
VPSGRLARLGLPVNAPPAAHNALDVLGRAGAPHCEEPLFRLRSWKFSVAMRHFFSPILG